MLDTPYSTSDFRRLRDYVPPDPALFCSESDQVKLSGVMKCHVEF